MHSPIHSNILPKTSRNQKYLLYLIAYYLVFIVAYSALSRLGVIESYKDLASSENIETPAYRARYVAAALISSPQLYIIFRKILKLPYLCFLLAFALLGFCLFVNSSSLFLGLSSLFAALSALTISRMLIALKEVNKSLLVISFILLLLPTTLALATGHPEFLYNSYYGRHRLLLGFVHPKEAAGCTFFLFMVAVAWFRFKLISDNSRFLRSLYVLMVVCSPPLFLLIGSRTTFLLCIGFSLASLLPFVKPLAFRFYLSILIPLVVILCLFVSLSNDSIYNAINTLSSQRLDLWSDYLSGSIQLGKSGSGISSALDNSYLNLWYDASPLGLVFFIGSLLMLFIYLAKRDYLFIGTGRLRYTSPSLFLLFILIAGITDSGLTSPTSLNFVTAWSLLIFIITEPSQRDIHLSTGDA